MSKTKTDSTRFDFLSPTEEEVLFERDGGTLITTDEARRRLEDAISYALENTEDTLINAPTGLGKTFTIATTPWRDYPELTEGEPVIHISQTTDARDGAVEMSRDAGIRFLVLRSREEVCPVANGEFDSEIKGPDGKPASAWFDRKCDTEQVEFSVAHDFLAEYVGGLPCSEDGPCESKLQWQRLHRGRENGDFDVIHATAQFAKVEPLIKDANVVFDEIPDYRLEVPQELIRRALNRYLQRVAERDDLTWSKLIGLSRAKDVMKGIVTFAGYSDSGTAKYTIDDSEPRLTEAQKTISEILEVLTTLQSDEADALSGDPYHPAHTLVPAIARATLFALPVGNRRYLGRDCSPGRGSELRLVFDTGNTYRLILDPPNLRSARCVIGLDAHPTKRLWQLQTGVEFEPGDLLSSRERLYWRKEERGLYVVQIGENTNPLTNGWRTERQKRAADAIIRELRRKAGSSFRTAIAPKAIKEDVRGMMKAAGIKNARLLHYGGEKSLNTFAGESVGLLLGCIDPGDHYVLNYLASMGLHAKPEMYETDAGETKRKHGRGFTGEDADAAAEFLASVRETHIAQSIGRYARNPRSSDSGAVVYVWTDAIPYGMCDGTVEGVKTRLSKEGELPPTIRAIDAFVRDHDGPVTAKFVSDEVGCRKETAWKILSEMYRQGIVSISRGTGKFGADEYEYLDGELGPEVELTIPD